MPTLTPLAIALQPLAGRLGLTAQLVEQRLARAWPQLVGPVVAAHTRPDSLRFKKLTLIADHSVWLQQLSFLKLPLLERITERFGPDVVTDFVFRVGDVPPLPVTDHSPAFSDSDLVTTGLAQRLREEAAERLQSITDPALRRQFSDVMARVLSVVPAPSRSRRVP